MRRVGAGFEAREAIIEVLDQAIADGKAEVRVVAYDLGEPDVVARLEKLGSRLRIIIDNDGAHGKRHSAESQAAKRLRVSAGAGSVKRQRMGKLQHNKTIVVDGPKARTVVCGSCRGFFVQSNNAFVMHGKKAVALFRAAFDHYWRNGTPGSFNKTDSARMTPIALGGIAVEIGFAPFSAAHSMRNEMDYRPRLSTSTRRAARAGPVIAAGA